MAEEIVKDIYRIKVPLPNNPLRELNSYFIRGDSNGLLIDTGFRCDECRNAIRQGLSEIHVDMDSMDVLLTHIHTDHSGLAPELAGKNRRIYLSRRDMRTLAGNLSRENFKALNARYIEEGFPKELLETIQKVNPASVFGMLGMDDRFTMLDEGDMLRIGNYTLRVILVPGHTPGSIMLWLAEQKIMFTGDHVLFDITPNITPWNGVTDSLGEYIASLQKAKEFTVETALPAHRAAGDYHNRIDSLLRHHRVRIQEIIRTVERNPGITAYDIAAHLSWKIRAANWDDFPGFQKWFAVGECIAHIDYLLQRDVLAQEPKGDILGYVLTGKTEIDI